MNSLVPWSKKWAELNTVPSPPTAITRSISDKCCLSNSTRFTHEKGKLFLRSISVRLLTHCWWALYRDSRRFQRRALGACPRARSWSVLMFVWCACAWKEKRYFMLCTACRNNENRCMRRIYHHIKGSCLHNVKKQSYANIVIIYHLSFESLFTCLRVFFVCSVFYDN